ncbi:hypothetical protein OIO90_004662 [Microbotryomycetes sp. JL221]|nr:hypothetical protein OIO90_004662 [Microbotryomycetes sp. JL221]
MAPIATALRFLHRQEDSVDGSPIIRSTRNVVNNNNSKGQQLQSRFSSDTFTTATSVMMNSSSSSSPSRQILKYLKRQASQHDNNIVPNSPLRSARLGHAPSASQGSLQWCDNAIKQAKAFVRQTQRSDGGNRVETLNRDIDRQASMSASTRTRRPLQAPIGPLPRVPLDHDKSSDGTKLLVIPPRSDSRNACHPPTRSSNYIKQQTQASRNVDGLDLETKSLGHGNRRPRPAPLNLAKLSTSTFKALLIQEPSLFNVLNQTQASHVVKLDVGGTIFTTTVATLVSTGCQHDVNTKTHLGQFVTDVLDQVKNKGKTELDSITNAFSRHSLLLDDTLSARLETSPLEQHQADSQDVEKLSFTPNWLTSPSTSVTSPDVGLDPNDFIQIGIQNSPLDSTTRLFQFPKPPVTFIPSPNSDLKIHSAVASIIPLSPLSLNSNHSSNVVSPTLIQQRLIETASSSLKFSSMTNQRNVKQQQQQQPFERALGPFFEALKLEQERKLDQLGSSSFKTHHTKPQRKTFTSPVSTKQRSNIPTHLKRKQSIGSTQTINFIKRKNSTKMKKFKLSKPPTGQERRIERRRAKFRKAHVNVSTFSLFQQNDENLFETMKQISKQTLSCNSSETSKTRIDSPLSKQTFSSCSTFSIFLDRDSTCYSIILSFLREGCLPINLRFDETDQDMLTLFQLDVCIGYQMLTKLRLVQEEAKWLGIDSLVQICQSQQQSLLKKLNQLNTTMVQGCVCQTKLDQQDQKKLLMKQRALAGWI